MAIDRSRRITEQEWLDHFVDVVKAAMKRHGYTNKTLAKEALISESALSQYLNGHHLPTPRAVINLSYALQLSVDDLMDAGGRII